jgi:hypothetical protein
MRHLALLLLGGLAVLAALTFLNVVRLEVNATLPPVSKKLNLSVYPLASARWEASDIYNVTYYGVKFVPGWPELYTVGYFVPRDPGWSARLEAVGRYGAGQYAIALGGQVQITESQNAGPPVPIAGATPLDWRILATQRFSILAKAWFSQGGTTAIQLVNFTAEPMTKLYQQTFSCTQQTYYDSLKYCTSDPYSFSDNFDGYTALPPYITKYLFYDANTGVAPVSLVGGQIRTQIDARGTTPTQGIAAAVYWTAYRWGLLGASGATISIQFNYGRDSADVRNNVVYVDVGVDTNGDGAIDTEVIYYWYETQDGNGRIYSIFVNPTQNPSPTFFPGTYVSIDSNGNPTATPPSWMRLNKQTAITSGQTVTANLQLTGITGHIIAVAFVVVNPSGGASGTANDFWAYWDNFAISGTGRCVASPGRIDGIARGYNYTLAFAAGNGFVTEADAGVSSSGYAIARYWLPSPIYASGASVSLSGTYFRALGDGQNNMMYVSVGVDTNWDGQIDKEYILYRADVVGTGQSGIIYSAFFTDAQSNPEQVCTVTSANPSNCAPTNTARYVVTYGGTLTNGLSYTWPISLNVDGIVLAVAMGATDYSSYGDGVAGDVFGVWSSLTITHYTCPLPSDWNATSPYVTVVNNYLLVPTSSNIAYKPLITTPTRALTYVANFTGVGTYAVFDSSLGVIFGVSASGSSFTALCGGGSTPLGSLPAARYVELRPLNGFGDVIIRDQYGAILARYGCRYTAAPQYVGFRGGLLRVYNVTALG